MDCLEMEVICHRRNNKFSVCFKTQNLHHSKVEEFYRILNTEKEQQPEFPSIHRPTSREKLRIGRTCITIRKQ